MHFRDASLPSDTRIVSDFMLPLDQVEPSTAVPRGTPDSVMDRSGVFAGLVLLAATTRKFDLLTVCF
jgi:hypothetical protein